MNAETDLIASSVSIPQRILKQMRCNKNFANVYTPYHEFEVLVESLEQKKEERRNRKKANVDRIQEPWQQNQYQDNFQLSPVMLNKSLLGDKNTEQSSAINNLKSKLNPIDNPVDNTIDSRAQATSNEQTQLQKKKMSKTRADRWLPKDNRRLDYDDKYQSKQHNETQNEFYDNDPHYYGQTALNFSKQENKKNRFVNQVKMPANAASNSSLNNYDKVKSSVYNPISSSMTSFPKRVPSILEINMKSIKNVNTKTN